MINCHPTLVVLCALVNENENKIALIKRRQPPYVNLWGLPGGKVKMGERVKETALRETEEETGIKCKFKNIIGIASEIAYREDKVEHHFMIFICELYPNSYKLKKSNEGTVKWFSFQELQKKRECMIPSDYLMIEDFLIRKRKRKYPLREINVIITKDGKYKAQFL